MTNTKRTIQFRRNSTKIYSSITEAKSAIQKIITGCSDGEQIFGRYYADVNKNQIDTVVGYITDYGDKKYITFSDTGGITKLEIKQVFSGTSYTDTTADKYDISATTQDGKSKYFDSFQLRFTPYSPSGLTVPVTVGDIEKGTKASELSGETLSKVLDDIIFPTKYPIITAPSISMVFSDTNVATTKTVKVGTTYYGLKTTYSKGKSTINDGVSLAKYYNGNYVNDVITLAFSSGSTANTSVASTNMSTPTTPTFTYATGSSTVVTIATNTTPTGYSTAYVTATTASKMDKIGTYKFVSTIYYGVGDTLITSKNSNPGTPLRYESLYGTPNSPQAPYNKVTNPNPSATTATTQTCQVNTTLPIFVTTGSTITKGSTSGSVSNGFVVGTLETAYENGTLLSWGAQGNSSSGGWTVTLPATTNTDGNRRIILTPRTLSGIYIPNLAGELKTQSISDYATSSTVSITINGTAYTYYQYRWNGGNAGTVQARITWN